MKTKLLLGFLTFSAIANAQWQNTNCPTTQLNCVAASGTNVFAGAAGGGVRGSIDNGNNWTICCYNGIAQPYILSLFIDGTNLFAATFSGVHLSTDSAANWVKLSNGLIATNSFDTVVTSIIKSGTNLLAGTDGGGVYLSTNYGSSWNAVNNGLTNNSIGALAVSGANIFAGTSGGGVFLSTNNGGSWNAVNTGLTNGNIKSLAIDGGNIYAGTSGGGIFLSTNNGGNWVAVNNGILNLTITSFAVSSGNIFAGTSGGGVFFSNNNGTSWVAENNGFTNSQITGLSISGTNIFASIYMGGVWRRPLSEMVGINEYINKQAINIYPNPTSDQFFIEANTADKLNVDLYDVNGRHVFSANVSDRSNINVTTLENGIYTLTIKSIDRVINKKLVIVR